MKAKLPPPRSISALDVEQLRMLAHWSGNMPEVWWIPENAPPRDAQFVLDIWHQMQGDNAYHSTLDSGDDLAPLAIHFTSAARRADRRSAMRKVFADDGSAAAALTAGGIPTLFAHLVLAAYSAAVDEAGGPADDT